MPFLSLLPLCCHATLHAKHLEQASSHQLSCFIHHLVGDHVSLVLDDLLLPENHLRFLCHVCLLQQQAWIIFTQCCQLASLHA